MRRAVIFALVVAAATVLVAPPAESALDRTLATVGSQVIRVSTYRHWREVARRAEPHATRKTLRKHTMSFLLSAQWTLGEAAEQAITVTAKQVEARFERDKRANFKSDSDFRRFLRQTGETVADLRFRTRIDMLNARLQRAGLPDDFEAKWRGRTLCLRGYTVTDYCGGVLSASTVTPM